MKKRGSIAKILVPGLVMFILMVYVGTSLIGYREFTAVLEKQYNNSAYEVADIALSVVNPDKFDYYLETKQMDDEYLAVQAYLNKLAVSADVTFIYVAAVSDNFDELTYIYEAVNSKFVPYQAYELGHVQTAEEGAVNPKYVEDLKDIMLKGKRASRYLYVYESESGAHTTAGVPVMNSKGKIVAVLGVEKSMSILNEARMTYVLHVAVFTLLIVIFAVALSVFALKKMVIGKLQTVTDEAARFADDNAQPSDKLLEVKGNNEIGTLAEAIYKMEIDTQQYIANLTAVTAERERIGAELAVAQQIQADMLPSIFPIFSDRKDFDIFASMDPAKEVGGDFYDFFLVDDMHLAIVVADVSGKGIPAALFMVIAKTLIKNHMLNGDSPEEAFTLTNDQLCENNKEGLFVTAWMGLIDLSTGSMIFVNAGHNPPLLSQGENSSYEFLRTRPGLVLAGMEGMKYRRNETVLKPGSTIYLYTDGVVEATDAEEELYGDDRLVKCINSQGDAPVKEICENIRRDVDHFAGEAPQFDDITMLCMRYYGHERESKDS